MPYIALDRDVLDFEPTYCVHGHTWCVNCKHKVLLGSESVQAVRDRGHLPICLDCAIRYAKVEHRTGHIEDHQVANGPHD